CRTRRSLSSLRRGPRQQRCRRSRRHVLGWPSSDALRSHRNLYGPEELEAFRKARPSAGLTRNVTRLDIVSFGRDSASITLEFERTSASGTVRGRQSQVWVRLPEGWRIVQVHVSLLPKS